MDRHLLNRVLNEIIFHSSHHYCVLALRDQLLVLGHINCYRIIIFDLNDLEPFIRDDSEIVHIDILRVPSQYYPRVIGAYQLIRYAVIRDIQGVVLRLIQPVHQQSCVVVR